MMIVNIGVAFTAYIKVEFGMLCKLREHMVEKAAAGNDI